MKKDFLFWSRHAIEIKPFLVHHSFGDVVFLFSFFKESTLVDDAHFYELIDVFRWESLWGKCFFILVVAVSLLVWHVKTWLFILISCIDKGCLFLAFCKFTSSCLFLYETCGETMRICHFFCCEWIFSKTIVSTPLVGGSSRKKKIFDGSLLICKWPRKFFYDEEVRRFQRIFDGAGDRVRTDTPKGWSLSTLTLLCYPRILDNRFPEVRGYIIVRTKKVKKFCSILYPL